MLRRPVRACLTMAVTTAITLLATQPVGAQNTAVTPGGEVRQIVTFLWQPGMSEQAIGIYEHQLKPIYAGIPAMRRFRAYREAESPEPLDLVVVSTYDNMAGMDAANDALRRAPAGGESAFALYGKLSAMTQRHHDQFVEMLPAASDSATDDTDLTVFEYIRVAPGAQTRFTALLLSSVRPFERDRGLYNWSETGRMLVSDGWDFLRIYGITSLGAWQQYREHLRTAPRVAEIDGLIAARKTIILKRDARMSVR